MKQEIDKNLEISLKTLQSVACGERNISAGGSILDSLRHAYGRRAAGGDGGWFRRGGRGRLANTGRRLNVTRADDERNCNRSNVGYDWT
jgi:hypothetical protein